MDSSSPNRDENNKYLKPSPSSLLFQWTVWMPGWHFHIFFQTINPSGSRLFRRGTSTMGTGFWTTENVDNTMQSDVNNEVYTVLETSILIHQKYHNFMVVQIFLPWFSSTYLSSQHLPPHMDPQSKVFHHFLPTPTMFCSPHNFNTSRFLRSPSTYITYCKYIYMYHSPSTPKNLRINNLPTWWRRRFDTSSLHSAIHLTEDGSGCPRDKGLIGWLLLGWFQGSYNTPLEHTPGNPLANHERNPFIVCW